MNIYTHFINFKGSITMLKVHNFLILILYKVIIHYTNIENCIQDIMHNKNLQ